MLIHGPLLGTIEAAGPPNKVYQIGMMGSTSPDPHVPPEVARRRNLQIGSLSAEASQPGHTRG